MGGERGEGIGFKVWVYGLEKCGNGEGSGKTGIGWRRETETRGEGLLDAEAYYADAVGAVAVDVVGEGEGIDDYFACTA